MCTYVYRHTLLCSIILVGFSKSIPILYNLQYGNTINYNFIRIMAVETVFLYTEYINTCGYKIFEYLNIDDFVHPLRSDANGRTLVSIFDGLALSKVKLCTPRSLCTWSMDVRIIQSC